ncbi:hypothetical protein QYE76_061835 [Lolium multiflorum]|uniref:Uncharacterized protein n=1 Tax=Lolium multiflorum TaxID=4521 RepID=A0AAD8W6P6_LOLMU|nr:hypothetical protein QYE76_061835 [Lolium multiflorum]
MEIEGAPEIPFGISDRGGRSRSSVLLVSVAGFLFTPANFAALMKFLARKLYTAVAVLKFSEPDVVLVHDLTVSHVDEGSQFGERLMHWFFQAKLIRGLSGSLPEDLAVRFELNALLSPRKRNWAAALGSLMLDEEGKVYWAEDYSSEDLLASFVSAGSELSQGEEAEVSSAARVRRKGRPRKTDTPQVESQVKRTLRSNNQGYNYVMLSYKPSRRKVSKVQAASTPAILQIEEMQRIGIEDCQIDPDALTVDRLMKQREEKE